MAELELKGQDARFCEIKSQPKMAANLVVPVRLSMDKQEKNVPL